MQEREGYQIMRLKATLDSQPATAQHKSSPHIVCRHAQLVICLEGFKMGMKEVQMAAQVPPQMERGAKEGFFSFLPFLNTQLTADNFLDIMEKCLSASDDRPWLSELLKFQLKEYWAADSQPGAITLEGARKLQAEVKDVVLILLTDDKKSAINRAVRRYMEKLRPALGAHWFIGEDPPTSGRALVLKPELTGFDTLLWNELDLFLSDRRWPDRIGRCPECGRIFGKLRSDQKWCSKSCKDRVYNRVSRLPRGALSS